MRIPALFWLVIILPIVLAFQPSLPLRRCSRRGHATRWSRKSQVVDKAIVTVKLPNVQDVEDETWVQPHHQHDEDVILLNRRISQESLISSISAPPQVRTVIMIRLVQQDGNKGVGNCIDDAYHYLRQHS